MPKAAGSIRYSEYSAFELKRLRAYNDIQREQYSEWCGIENDHTEKREEIELFTLPYPMVVKWMRQHQDEELEGWPNDETVDYDKMYRELAELLTVSRYTALAIGH